MKQTIQISVVIPAYNEEKYLPKCLKSLKKQIFDEKYEIIVVDNNSTDNTTEIALKYGVKVVKENRRGVCFARQRGALEAKGNIIVSTDADSVFHPDWLKNIHEEIIAQPDIIATFGPFRFETKPKWGWIYSQILFKVVKFFYIIRHEVIYIPASNFACRRSILMKINGYNTALAQGGDEHDLLKRLRPQGPISYLSQNNVLTSSRRLGKGIIYNLFINLIVFYFIDYYIIAQFTGKSTLGQWAACREIAPPKRNWLLSLAYVILFLFLSLSFIFGTGKVYAKARFVTGSKKVFSATKEGFSDVKDERKNISHLGHLLKHRHYSDKNK